MYVRVSHAEGHEDLIRQLRKQGARVDFIDHTPANPSKDGRRTVHSFSITPEYQVTYEKFLKLLQHQQKDLSEWMREKITEEVSSTLGI